MRKSHLFEFASAPLSRNVYVLASGERPEGMGAAGRAAWELESLAAERGWSVGEVLGCEADLIRHLAVSRDTFREAVRIVENRGSLRMVRGCGGGLRIHAPQVHEAAARLAACIRANGLDEGQLRRATAALDFLLVTEAMQRTGNMPRLSDETPREWLARLGGESLHLMSFLALGMILAGRGSTGERGAGDAGQQLQLHAALVSGDRATALEILGSTSFVPIDFGELQSNGFTSGRAGTVAMRIADFAHSSGTTLLGTEACLRNTFDPSRAVIRQALRILDDMDMLVARRGAGGGYQLRRPSPIGAIRQVFPLLAAEQRSAADLITLMWNLNAIHARQATIALATLSSRDRSAKIAGLERRLNECQGPERFVVLQQEMAAIADNPLIDTLARAIVCYQARRGGRLPDGPAESVILDGERAIITALAQGREDQVEQALQNLQTQMRAAIGPGH